MEEFETAMRENGIFPPFFPPRGSSEELRQSARRGLEGMRRFVEKEPGEYAYAGMQILPLALILKDDPEAMRMLEDALTVLLEDVPTADTEHYSEIYVAVEREGERFFEQHNDIPQNWSATSSYLAAVAVFHPEVIEEALARPVSLKCEEGCSCSVSPLVFALPFLAILFGRRRFSRH